MVNITLQVNTEVMRVLNAAKVKKHRVALAVRLEIASRFGIDRKDIKAAWKARTMNDSALQIEIIFDSQKPAKELGNLGLDLARMLASTIWLPLGIRGVAVSVPPTKRAYVPL